MAFLFAFEPLGEGYSAGKDKKNADDQKPKRGFQEERAPKYCLEIDRQCRFRPVFNHQKSPGDKELYRNEREQSLAQRSTSIIKLPVQRAG